MWRKLFASITLLWMISSVCSVEVTCEWKYGGMCVISNLPPITSPDEDITLKGSAASFVFFNSTILRYIPRKIFTVMPNINMFYMLNTFTTNLITDTLVNCGNIQTVCIQAENFPNVPAGFAQSCSNIKTLMMKDDGIQTMDVNALKGLVKLENLNMQGNKITCLPPEIFQNTPVISDINFVNNKILAIDAGLFKNLPRLHVIDLSGNMLSYLPLLDITGSAALNGNLAVFLPGNPINAIDPKFCSLFDTRPTNVIDMIDIPGVKCLPNTAQTSKIYKSNCLTTMAPYLQKCYANWTVAMSFPVPCSSSSCALFLWQQFMNYLKTIT